MPRSLLLRPLGGLTGKTRKRYALFQKIMLVEESNRLRVEQNFSIRRAGEVLGVPFPLLSKWGKEVARLRAAIQAQRRACNRKALIDGPASQLESIEDELHGNDGDDGGEDDGYTSGDSLFGSNDEEGEESGDDEDSEDEGDNDH